MKINKIKISNFKGAEEQTLTFGGKSALITGANGSGKSRNIDAICWLLTGKDSFGSAAFDIKPMKQGEDGSPTIDRGVNNDKQIECIVEAEFIRSDSTVFLLKRRYKENWVKKTGADKSEYRGDTTDYFIDGVPNAKKDYDAFVEKEFGQEQLIRLLLNPVYFNEQTKDPKERRDILFSVFGDMTDEEIIASNKELIPLTKRLEGRAVEGFQKMMAAVKKETVDELNDLPVRIDEAYKGMVEGVDAEQSLIRIEQCDTEIALCVDCVNGLGKNSEREALTDKLADKKRELERLQVVFDNTAEDNERKHSRQYETDLSNAEQVVSDIEKNIKILAADRRGLDCQVSQLATERKSKLSRYTELNESTFSAETTCPTCNQEFSTSRIDEMRGNWNENKSDNLSKIVADGKTITEELAVFEKKVGESKLAQLKLDSDLMAAVTTLEALKDNYKPYEPNEVEQTAHKAVVVAYGKEISNLEKQVSEFGTDDSVAAEKAELEERINNLGREKAEYQKLLAQVEVNKKAEERIAGYSELQKELGAIRDDAELMLYLCELFTRTKASAISDNINKHFQIVSFQLFEELKNGGIKEVCETTANGKTYSGRGMNKALRVAANLDIAVTFSQKVGKQLPIFLDDVEGAFDRYGVETGDAQVITLMAVEKGELEVVLGE